ncbi:hypothetical protein DYH09_16770 [bacterium CPR1]|nr:hypothetical protein [bacterium CPR1]
MMGTRATRSVLLSLLTGTSSLLFSLSHRWGWDVFSGLAVFLVLGLLQVFAGGYLVLAGPHPARPASLLGLAWSLSLVLTALAALWAIDHASGC